MLNRRDVIYLYDGSFSGLLCAVFTVFLKKEIPEDIVPAQNAQASFLCEPFMIESEETTARRVADGIKGKISSSAFSHIFRVYLSDAPGKEMMILRFVLYGLRRGRGSDKELAAEPVDAVRKVSQKVGNEAHLWIQFVRFSKLKTGVYYSGISPKCSVLPLLARHFVTRYANMPFVIHDKTHGLCLIYNGKEYAICEAAGMPRLDYDGEEADYRRLWKTFFDTVEIRERHNERCQRNHLPKWFRREMMEFWELL